MRIAVLIITATLALQASGCLEIPPFPGRPDIDADTSDCGVCDDGIACTKDQCGASGQCVFTPIAGVCECVRALDCDDGNPCNGAEICGADGACSTGDDPIVCGDSADPCHPNICNSGTATCISVVAATGMPCDDGDPCTAPDTCTAGTCGGPPNACDDDVACTADTCTAGLGCVHTPDAATCGCVSDADCDDGAVCNGAERCDGARFVCMPGSAATDETDCDDGVFCTINDRCAAGVCDGTLRDCSDSGPACAIGHSCDIPTDKCAWNVATCECTKNADCSDGNACNGIEICTDAGKCAPGTPIICADSGDPCHPNACDNNTGLCISLVAATGTPCDDGNLCTDDDRCIAGTCEGKATWDTQCEPPLGNVGFCRYGECRARAAVTGAAHSCALIHGDVYCWGINSYGIFGSPKMTFNPDVTAAEKVPFAPGEMAVGLSGGFVNVCALLSDGSVRCWGTGGWGELGPGNSENIGDDEPASDGLPVLFASPAVKLCSGFVHSCVVLDSGAVVCWGSNASGQLGGDAEGLVTAVPSGATAVSCGEFHTCVLVGGDVSCFGTTDDGALGLGAGVSPSSPLMPIPLPFDTAKQVFALDGQTCVTRAGPMSGIVCFGGGPEAKAAIDMPVLDGWADATLDIAYAKCRLGTSGGVRCWPYPGPFMTSDFVSASIGATVVAEDLVLGGPLLQLSARAAHACGVRADGAIICWGDTGSGKLGHSVPEEGTVITEPSNIWPPPPHFFD